MNKYRIVTNPHGTYDIEVKYRWWPFWAPAGYSRLTPIRTIEDAKARIDSFKTQDGFKKQVVG